MGKIWHFAPSLHTQDTGGEDSDQFPNDPINNLAREIIQNSLDARKDDAPAVVEFHLFTTPTEDFPGLDSMVDYIMRLHSQKTAAKNASPKEITAVKNFMTALGYANKTGKIAWLRISDFNTTGLWGSSTPANKNTAWHAFIHGVGKNQKGEKSGGSKGQGKRAIFVNSSLKTMLVSTYSFNEDTQDEEKASIGVARLLSLTLDEEDSYNPDTTLGIGYCVNDDEKSIKYHTPTNELLEIDPEFSREEMGYGTDIYLPFFAAEEYWDDVIAIETLISFLPAILDGDLRVVISYDTTTVKQEINSSNITRYLAGKGWGKKDAEAIYTVLTSTNTKKIKYTEKSGFEMTLCLLQDNLDGLNNVYEYRLPTKMKIRKEAKDSSVGYTGVLFVEGEEICKRLRSIEDATHSNWYVGRYKETEYDKKQIEEALYILDNFISSECQKFGTTGSEEAIYFDIKGWDTEEESLDMSVEEKKEIGLPTNEIIFDMKNDDVKNPRRKRLKKKGNVIDDNGSAEANVMDIGQTGEGDEEYSHPEGHNKGTGGEIHEGDKVDNYDPEKGETLVIARRRIATVNARMPSICPEDGLFDLVFKPEKTGTDAHIEILKAGVDGENETTKIISALMDDKALPIEKNRIVLEKIVKNTEYRIHLKLDETSNYIWEVNIDAED